MRRAGQAEVSRWELPHPSAGLTSSSKISQRFAEQARQLGLLLRREPADRRAGKCEGVLELLVHLVTVRGASHDPATSVAWIGFAGDKAKRFKPPDDLRDVGSIAPDCLGQSAHTAALVQSS